MNGSSARTITQSTSNFGPRQAPSRANKGFFVKHRINLLRLALLVFMLAFWQIFSGKPGEGLAFIDSYYVSKPSEIARQLMNWIESNQLWFNVWASIKVMVVGFTIGAVSGIVIGFLLGTNRPLAQVLTPFLIALYSVPRLALMPLLLLWFGLGMASKVALVVMVSFFLVFNNTYNGVREVNASLIDIVRVMGASRMQIYRMVMLPSALVWVISGFKVSIPYALVGTVIGEMQSSNSGLGFLLARSSGLFNIHGTFSAILVIMTLALILDQVVDLFERRLLRWKYAKG